MAVTLFLLAVLGGIFLKGFSEAIHVAVGLVAVYLALNVIVTVAGIPSGVATSHVMLDWKPALFTQHGNIFPFLVCRLCFFRGLRSAFPGFETGVAVMPLIECEGYRGSNRQYQDPALHCGGSS